LIGRSGSWTSGDVLMAAAYNGRIHNAIKAGKNFAITWEGQEYMIDYWAIISGTPNLNEAYEYIKFALAKEQQIKFAEGIPYGPTNKAAISAMPAKVAANLPNAPEHMKNALRYVPEFWADRAEELLERFNAWASK
jgi:putative spermidine/putrescine transport system substrate-binding protein